jgi:predicted site-specific integrase-resolvase
MAKKKKSAKQAAPKTITGWKAIGDYLGIGAATAQRWAKSGMPVRREGRYTVADADEISRWLGREAHMPAPAQVATRDTDIAAAMKQSIAAVRGKKRT